MVLEFEKMSILDKKGFEIGKTKLKLTPKEP